MYWRTLNKSVGEYWPLGGAKCTRELQIIVALESESDAVSYVVLYVPVRGGTSRVLLCPSRLVVVLELTAVGFSTRLYVGLGTGKE